MILDLVKVGSAQKLADVRFLATPRKIAPLVPAPDPVAPPPETVTISRKAIAGALACLAVLLSFGAAAMARNRTMRRSMIAAAGLFLATACSLLVTRDWSERANAMSATPLVHHDDAPPSLATLLPLRRAIASGSGDVAAAYKSVDRAHGCGAIADLWKMQFDLQQAAPQNVKAALASFPSPSNVPLAEILRGRLALLENDDAAAAVAFEHAINLGPGRDGIWYESAEALMALGYDDRAMLYLSRLVRMGSRESDVYYALAVLAAAKNHDEEAEQNLVAAWRMRPAERQELFSASVLWSVLRRESVASMISVSAPSDPVVLADGVGTRPLHLPPDALAETSGQFLHVQLGEQDLSVPGGAVLAPAGTPAVAATTWAHAEEERRLADLPQLMVSGRTAAAYAQPALRQRIVGTTSTLASRNRWADVVQLTDNLSASAEHVPPAVFFLRSIGLRRMQRAAEADRLLAEVAGSRALQRKRDAGAMIELAELFAASDLYDAAVRMYDRSQNIRANPQIDDRVRQIQMNKRLATSYSVHRPPHFEIHFPSDVGASAAMELGGVMERELARLQEWIPVPSFRPTIVNVVWWQEFRSTYTGSDFVLGFYNGKITVPFAGAPELSAPLVAILSHELAHAMIAQATNDNAPHWFQEGLAQRIEQRPYHENAFNMYDDQRLLPVSLLDAVLRGSPDPEMISAAYIVSQTDMRYIESRYGRASIHRLLDAFRDGMTTDEALAHVSGKSMAAFETDLRSWGRSEQRVFDNTVPQERKKRIR